MVFPGVLRGRPGPRLATIHTSQPRRSLSSPWMFVYCSVASGRNQQPQIRRPRRLNEIDAVPGRLEEPFADRPESLPTIGGAASHLGGLALCGSGSASSSKVRLLLALVKRVLCFPRTFRKKRLRRHSDGLLGPAYDDCDNGWMDGEVPLASEAPFGAPRRPLRKRIGSAFAGIAALAAKFGAYLKTGLFLLPKLALLSTAGHRADIDRRLQPAVGLDVRRRLRGPAVRARDGACDSTQARGDQGEHADVHSLPRGRDLLALARRGCARRGARGLGRDRFLARSERSRLPLPER